MLFWDSAIDRRVLVCVLVQLGGKVCAQQTGLFCLHRHVRRLDWITWTVVPRLKDGAFLIGLEREGWWSKWVMSGG